MIAMAASPISFRSIQRYYLLLFILLIISAIVGVEIAEYTFVVLPTKPFYWTIHAVMLFTSLIPLIAVLSWKLRSTLMFKEPQWNFQVRELNFRDFQKILTEYRRKYIHIVQRFDPFLFVAVISTMIVAIIAPYLVYSISVHLLVNVPYLFGGLVILYGLLLSRLLYGIIPTKASKSFPLVNMRELKCGLAILSECNALSWVGVNITIGESAGFFTIRDVHPVGWLVGIEESGKVHLKMAGTTPQSAKINLGEITEIVRFADNTKAPPALVIRNGIVRAIESYLANDGIVEDIEELIDELNIDVRNTSKN